MAIQRALLLIADIGGYTRFMKVHQLNLAHAQDVISGLLSAVIDAARSPLKLAKLEGDAAFFYAPLGSEDELAAVQSYIAAIRRGFLRQHRTMVIDQICTCDGCTQIKQLTLKFVAHAGEIAIHKVKRFTELAGVDVILVHRLLKNSVPLREYVLMTNSLADALPPDVRAQGRPLEEDLEGLGRVPLTYLDLQQLAPAPAEQPEPSFVRRWASHVVRNARSVPYLLNLKKPCDGFRNFNPTGAA